MLNLSKKYKLKEWFGDFGGSAFDNDFKLIDNQTKAKAMEDILSTEEFEKSFRDILKLVLPSSFESKRHILEDGTELLIFPAYGKYYSLAGQLALAHIQKKCKIYTAAYSKELAMQTARACKFLGFELSIILSEKLSSDMKLIKYLEGRNIKVDSRMSTELFDFPMYFVEPCIDDSLNSFMLQFTANYGTYPQPALVGTLAGIYSEDIKKRLKEIPDCLVVPIKDGTEAIAAFKEFLTENCKLITVENTIAQEYHLIDYFTYTLATRSADKEQMNTTICPELAHWWRDGIVTRAGCDRIKPLDTSHLSNAGLSPSAKRAVAIALEMDKYNKILVTEVG